MVRSGYCPNTVLSTIYLSYLDKTIEVLFKGAKISQNKQSKTDTKTCTSTSLPVDTDSKHCLKQTVLNNKCQLQKTTLLVSKLKKSNSFSLIYFKPIIFHTRKIIGLNIKLERRKL